MTEWSGKQQRTLPEEVIARFRVTALERLERLEAAWMHLATDPSDAETAAEIEREVHTLKGEARMVGFTDVDMVAHKLEDVLEVARERGFQISDDLDLVATMAMRFMAMLIRKKAGQTLGGIDLPGFVRQIDAVVRDTRRQHPLRGRIPTAPSVKLDPHRELLSGAVRDRLAGVALDLFLELSSGKESRRVRRAWNQLRDSLSPPDPTAVAAVLEKHEKGAEQLARELGKEVELEFALDGDARAPAPIVDALDIATLHLVRNAIDHGIEVAAARRTSGKVPRGVLRVRCALENGRAILEVSDDGHGIDFPRVLSRAIELELVEPTATPSDAELSKVLFYSGMTTRGVATPVSGRGIGLDAVHNAVKAVGGTIDVTSRPGAGTTWTIAIPCPQRRFPVRLFAVRGTTVPFAIPTDWEIEIAPSSQDAVDLADELGLSTPSPNPLTYVLVRGDMTVRIGAATEPVDADARWLVSTLADTLVGVAAVAGYGRENPAELTESLVLRPDVLVSTSGRVAIIDDSEIVRELVGFSLKPHGIEVQAFDDPAPAPGTLAVKPVDLVLLDLSFKGVDVGALVARLRAAVPDCAVYLHSDRTPVELARIAETSLADGYIAKALGRDQFVSRVLKILRSRPRRG